MKFLSLAVLGILLSASVVCAQQSNPLEMLRSQFASLDTDRNGEISSDEFLIYKMQEAKQVSAKAFEKLDTDGNGSISEQEYLQKMRLILEQLQKIVQSQEM